MFKVGDKVWCDKYGLGLVIAVHKKKELDDVTINLMKNMKYIIEDYTERKSIWQTLMNY